MKNKLLEEKLEIVSNNTIKLLNEELPADAAGIASIKSRIDGVIERIYKDSIAAQVCDVQPCYGPSGIIFYTKRVANKMTVGSMPFEVDDEIKEIANVSKEWWQDFSSVTGQNAAEYLIDNLMQDISEELDKKFIAKLNEIAPVVRTITFTSTSDMYSGFMSIMAAVFDGSGIIAKETERGHRPYVIASTKVAAALATLGFMTGLPSGRDTDDTNINLIGNLYNTKVFIDYDATSDYLLVGHKGNYVGDSTIILAPYALESKVAEEASVDTNGVLVHNRFKFVRHPLDNTGVKDSKFVKRYNINFSAMTNF